MTNETQTKKTLEVLFGDDQFADISTEMIFKGDYVSQLAKKLPNLSINWNCQENYLSTIKEVQTGKYDVVVTDLQYTTNGKEGFEVVDTACNLSPRPLIVLCTNARETQQAEGKADYIAKPHDKCFHKFDSLIEVLAKHFGGSQ
ncbi:MAG: hypothetical protein WCI72_04310 [archaeon]